MPQHTHKRHDTFEASVGAKHTAALVAQLVIRQMIDQEADQVCEAGMPEGFGITHLQSLHAQHAYLFDRHRLPGHPSEFLGAGATVGCIGGKKQHLIISLGRQSLKNVELGACTHPAVPGGEIKRSETITDLLA